MTTRLAVASFLALGACSSKHDAPAPAKDPAPAPAPAPTPPPPTPGAGLDLHGVTVQVEGDHTTLVDPVGGLRIDVPGTPEIESAPNGMTASLSTSDSDLIVTIGRRAPDEVPKDVQKAYERMIAVGAKDGLTVIDQGPVTLAGLDGYKYLGSDVDQDGHLAAVRLWMLEVPDKATGYQVMIRTPGEKDPPASWLHVPDSLRAVK